MSTRKTEVAALARALDKDLVARALDEHEGKATRPRDESFSPQARALLILAATRWFGAM